MTEEERAWKPGKSGSALPSYRYKEPKGAFAFKLSAISY